MILTDNLELLTQMAIPPLAIALGVGIGGGLLLVGIASLVVLFFIIQGKRKNPAKYTLSTHSSAQIITGVEIESKLGEGKHFCLSDQSHP